MIKVLITGGCSFSHSHSSEDGWHIQLERKLKLLNNNLISYHTGYGSQGQELIQKKIMLSAVEVLENNYKPEEILIIPMWSGTYRKAWYIDNPHIIKEVVDGMYQFDGGMSAQFLNLKNEIDNEPLYFKTKSESIFPYNPNGGWLFTVNGSEFSHIKFIRDHYDLDQHFDGVGKIHTSIENIISLQNFCRANNIRMINQFFMDFVWRDIENRKDNFNISYLYKQFDKEYTIKEGMFETIGELIGIERKNSADATHADRIRLDNNRDIFSKDGFHPGKNGSKYWVNNVLYPFLIEKNIIKMNVI